MLKKDNNFYYNSNDLEYYRKNYYKVIITSSNTCLCYKIIKKQYIVEGWIFNGKEWSPAYRNDNE